MRPAMRELPSNSTLPWFITNPQPEVFLRDSYVCLDFETTNIEHGSPYDRNNRLLLACWVLGKDHPAYGRDGRVHSRWGSEFEQQQLLEHIASAEFIVAHFTKFELGWLERCGLALRSTLPYCSQIGEYVIAGNRKLPGGLGLEATAARYGLVGKRSFVHSLIKGGVCPSEIPPKYLHAYCEQDVRLTEQVLLQQRQRLAADGLLPVAYARGLSTPALVDMESRGMCLDPARVAPVFADYSTRYGALLKTFETVTGGINPKSAPQMREYLYTKLAFAEATDHRGNPLRTSGGKKKIPAPRTDKKVLPLLKATTEAQKEFKHLAIEIAKLKVPVQNLTKMSKLLKKGERISYATINQTVTDTHRTSSTGRNGGFQQQNLDRDFKTLFRAREPGWLVVESDAPQLEFRVAAFLGNDAVAKQEIESGSDIHALTAEVYGVKRQDAKAKTFAPLYGSTSGSAKDKAYQKAFRAKYKGIYDTQTKWTYDVLKDKKLRIASGLVFYWPDTVMSNSGYIKNRTSIFNYGIQSFATADIMPLTLALVWHGMAGMRAFPIATIHDSIVFECPQSELDSLVECVVQCFTDRIYPLLNKLYDIDFNIPLGVGIKAGTFWSEGAESKFERGDKGRVQARVVHEEPGTRHRESEGSLSGESGSGIGSVPGLGQGESDEGEGARQELSPPQGRRRSGHKTSAEQL